MFLGGGTVGEYVDVAVNVNVGVALGVVFEGKGSATVLSGIELLGAGVMIDTFEVPILATYTLFVIGLTAMASDPDPTATVVVELFVPSITVRGLLFIA